MNDIGIGMGLSHCHKHKTSNAQPQGELILMKTDSSYFKVQDDYVALEKPSVSTAKKIDKSYWNF